jgi:hypothetical protein
VLAEFHRTLSPGAHLMLASHVGDDEHLRPTQAHGNRQVPYESHLLPPERIVELLDRAELVIAVRLVQEPVEGRSAPCGSETRTPLDLIATSTNRAHASHSIQSMQVSRMRTTDFDETGHE